MELQLKHFGLFFGIVFCFIVGWVLVYRGCGHQTQPSVDNRIIDSIKILHQIIAKRADSIKYFREKDEYNNSVIDDIVKMYQDADSVARLNGTLLSKTQKQLATAKAAKDTIGQLRECDSLNNQVTLWRAKFDESDNLCNQYVFQTAKELYTKDRTIETQARQINDLASLNVLADTAYKMLQGKIVKPPLLRGYLGATGTAGAYSSFGIHLDLLNRKDFMYKGAVRLGSGGISYEAGVSKLISFKRR